MTNISRCFSASMWRHEGSVTKSLDAYLSGLGRCKIKGRDPVVPFGNPLMVGYSAKNKRFNKSFFSDVFTFARARESSLSVTMFDLPYAFNDAAIAGRNEPTRIEFAEALRLGDEREAMVNHVHQHYADVPLEVLRWPNLDLPTIWTLRNELRLAAAHDKAVRKCLAKLVQGWLGESKLTNLENLFQFQVEEIPVAINLYYERGLLFDIYPGGDFSFFYQLEVGSFSRAMPIATALAVNKKLTVIEPL